MSGSRDQIAQALLSANSPDAQFNQDKYGPGLQSPAIDPIMLLSAVAAPSIANALTGIAQSAPRALASQAGAIFPEGGPLPANMGKAAWKELGEVLPESQANYLRNKTLADWHASNYDFPAVLRDKWALLTHSQGG